MQSTVFVKDEGGAKSFRYFAIKVSISLIPTCLIALAWPKCTMSKLKKRKLSLRFYFDGFTKLWCTYITLGIATTRVNLEHEKTLTRSFLLRYIDIKIA